MKNEDSGVDVQIGHLPADVSPARVLQNLSPRQEPTSAVPKTSAPAPKRLEPDAKAVFGG